MIRSTPPLIAALIAGFLLTQSIQAAPTWNNAVGGNWSVGANWNPTTPPGTADNVIFGDVGAGSPNTDDIIGCTINSLTYNQVNAAQQTTTINPGQTLTINGSGAAGTALLNVGAANLTGLQVPVVITGAGGTLNMNGAGNLVVRQGGTAGGAQMATLDLSGLDTFNATIGRLLVAQTAPGDSVNRDSGTLILAKTNNITLTGASPQVMIQDANVNANGSVISRLTFGQNNILNADTLRLGGQKGNATISFNGAFSLPSLVMRNADGVSPCTVIDFGYNAAVSTGNSTVSIGDFSQGTVDIQATRINVPQGPIGTSSGSSTGTLTLGAGTISVSDLEIGWGNAAGNSGATTGTLNVNNNGSFPAGATVSADTMLRLARTNGGSATVTGTLNVNGGTVRADTIVSGGGVSAINLNSYTPASTLVVTNSAGTLSFPIGTFSMSDATLTIPALNGGATVAVKNLTVGGSQNLINISAVPPLGAYPADFTLINYQTGAGGNFVLGSLPPASPSYSGSLVDLGNGVVILHLTAGPIVDLSLRWTGASDGNWDTSTYNWIYQGNATNFFPGSTAIFDDNTTQPTINLAAALAPGSVTVSNNVQSYNFTGSGNIAGASLLTKKGSNSLIVDNAGIDTFGTVVINSGTLQIGTGGTDGDISALNITNNGALVVNRSGGLTLSASITGTGSLTKTGDGTLILSGVNSYTGTDTLTGGTLQIDGTSAGAGALTTSVGTVLAGSGTVSRAITVGGQLSPGPATGTGVFNANGGLTLNSGSTVNFDLSAVDPANPAVNDSVNVVGNLNLNNNTITVNINGTPQNGAQYTLFTYTGTRSGNFNPVIIGTHFAATVDTSNPGIVYLNITSGSGADLNWASVSDSAWDLTATNWMNLNSGVPSVFYAGDSVLLDDSNGVVTGITIASGVTVTPSNITNDSTNNNFTISGAGHIAGSGGLVKTGPSTLAVNTANTFSGLVDVQAGTLQTGNGAALGTTAAGTTVEAGATLDLNGQNLGGEVITLSSNGVNGVGALVNNGGGQNQALRQIILAGDATIGGTGLIGINNGGGTASLSTSGNPFSLTKVGGNQVTFQNFGFIDAALANIDIQQGIIEFSGLTASMGDPAYTNTVEAGATLSFAQNTVAWNKQFVFYGNGSSSTVNVGTGGNETLAGPVELHGDCVFNVGGTSLTIAGGISGDGGLIKNGGSPLIINSSTLYTGDTTINGTSSIRLVAPADLATSTNIVINSGGFLTVTGMIASTFPLLSDHTLRGHGVINGALTANAGSVVSPSYTPSSGATALVGLLTVSNAIVLSGTTIMELDPDNATNDVLKSGVSTITYGGTLILTNITSSPLANGSSFKLFSATGYLNSFASVVPATPGAGQTWDISALNTSGTIKVLSTAPPKFSSIIVSGGNVVLSGSNGAPSTLYYVLTSTNLALPRINWSSIATNSFDLNGNFAFTNSLTPAVPQRFYQIQLP